MKLCHDLGIVSSLSPHVLTLEIGTNDLASLHPEVTASEIEELIRAYSLTLLRFGSSVCAR